MCLYVYECIYIHCIFSHPLLALYIRMEGRSAPDCTACKLVGAGGCFAGAAYAMYERAKIPVANKNRIWLSIISVGGPRRHNSLIL